MYSFKGLLNFATTYHHQQTLYSNQLLPMTTQYYQRTIANDPLPPKQSHNDSQPITTTSKPYTGTHYQPK